MAKNSSDSDFEIIQIDQNQYDDDTDNHNTVDIDTPLRNDAFDISDDEKIQKIKHYTII